MTEVIVERHPDRPMTAADATAIIEGGNDCRAVHRLTWHRSLLSADGQRMMCHLTSPDLESVRKVCSALSKPFNFMVGIKGKSFTVAELANAGVKRISLATSLYRMAMTGLVDAAREVKDKGTFGYIDRSLATPDMNAFMQG